MEQIGIFGTGLHPSRIGLGTWSIGGAMWGGTDEEPAIRTIEAALDRGITLIDTAPVYGYGSAERRVGKALARHGRRDEIVIATKVGLAWDEAGGITRDSTPARIDEEIEASLRRLGTDHIDLYQVHWPDSLVPVHETAEALARLHRQGKIRAIGVSNYSPKQMDLFRQAAPLHTAQPPYNLFEREIEGDVLPYCRRHRIAVVAYGALCRSLLSGEVGRERRFPEGDLRRVDPKFQGDRFGQYLEAVSRLDRFAREHYGRSVLHLALRWILDRGVEIALWGARRPEQLDPLAEVEGWTIDADAMEAIDRILAETIRDPVGPEFMAPPARAQSPPM